VGVSSKRLVGTPAVRSRLSAAALLTAPLAWLVVIYLGSLAVLLYSGLWHFDADLTFTVQHTVSWANYAKVLTDPDHVYWPVTVRTVGIAVAVTLFDAALAFPLAWFMAKHASRRSRAVLAMLVVMPLWTSYLVKVLAWRLILSESGVFSGLLAPLGTTGPGFSNWGVWLTLSYIWLPYMIIPLATGFERLPSSLLEASGDLGARTGTTLRRVILPLVFPSLVAGSIFTFSLTLGDYIAVGAIGRDQFIGTVIAQDFGTDVPLGAAFAAVPIAIMVAYLLVAKRLRAFESL
jgi:putative spermidine/putrescine transport system permease protein